MKLAIPRRAVLIAATAPVAAVAAMASYHHIHTLAAAHHQPEIIAATLPLSVDGMILSGSYAMTDGRTHRGVAWATFLTGVLFSLAANILVAEPDPISRVISAFPSISLLLTVEVLIRANRNASAAAGVAAAMEKAFAEHDAAAIAAELEAALPVETRALAALLAANDAGAEAPAGDAILPEGMFWIAIEDAAPLDSDATAPAAPAPTSAQDEGRAQRQPSLADDLLAQVRALLEENPEMSDSEIGERIGRKPRTATRYRQAVQHELAAKPDAAAEQSTEKVTA